MEQKIIKFFDDINVILSAIITGISTLINGERTLFIGYLILNIIDFITGNIKARINKTESSVKGIKGIIKKTGYWILILVAFLSAYMLDSLGNIIGVEISFVIYFGWFTLGCLIINEIRSILENLKEIGINIPDFLFNGLEVVQKMTQAKENELLKTKEEEDDSNEE